MRSSVPRSADFSRRSLSRTATLVGEGLMRSSVARSSHGVSLVVCLSRTEQAENRNESSRQKLKLWSSPKTPSQKSEDSGLSITNSQRLGSGTHGSIRPSHCAVGKEAWRRRGLSVVKSRYSFNCMPQFDLNFEFGGQTTETETESVWSRRKRASNGEDKVYCS